MIQKCEFPVGDFIVLTRNRSGNFGRKHVTTTSKSERSSPFHGDLYVPVVVRNKTDYNPKFIAQVRRKEKSKKEKRNKRKRVAPSTRRRNGGGNILPKSNVMLSCPRQTNYPKTSAVKKAGGRKSSVKRANLVRVGDRWYKPDKLCEKHRWNITSNIPKFRTLADGSRVLKCRESNENFVESRNPDNRKSSSRLKTSSKSVRSSDGYGMEYRNDTECDEPRQVHMNDSVRRNKSTVKTQYVPKLVRKKQRETSRNTYKSYECLGNNRFPVNRVPRPPSRSTSTENVRREIKTNMNVLSLNFEKYFSKVYRHCQLENPVDTFDLEQKIEDKLEKVQDEYQAQLNAINECRKKMNNYRRAIKAEKMREKIWLYEFK